VTKRKPALHPEQIGFEFGVPETARRDGMLRMIERKTASAVATILKRDPRTRYEVAAGMSELLDEDVSKLMLDAYASEARETHNISFGRFLALVADTQSYDVLNALLRDIGAKVVVGEEALTLELGHLERQKRLYEERIRALKSTAPLLKGGHK